MPHASRRRPRRVRLGAVALTVVLALVVLARGVNRCTSTRSPRTPAGKAGSLVLGEYDGRDVTVVDGDTLKLADGTRVRVLALDTEEVSGSPANGSGPQKYATPAGHAASDEARRLVGAARRIRLERDHATAPTEDVFGRLLAHAVLLGPDGEALLSEALIQGGHSPYFVKYGRSRRFDDRLQRAEQEARRAGRGIWGTDGPRHYPDYPERLAWWHRRADQVDRWRQAPPAPDRVDLEAPDAADRLEALVGRRATVFGVVRNKKDEGRPRILWLRHRPRNDFAVVVFDEEVWRALDHDATSRLFVTVEGPVSLFRGRPQIVVTDASWISTE